MHDGRRVILNHQLIMVEIINRQRKRKLNSEQWRKLAERAIQLIGPDDRDAAIVFVSDSAIKELNRKFRGKNYTTDVLSFPSGAEEFEKGARVNLGEVVISLDRAAAQAKQNSLNLTNEVQQLILHGLLHLAGYDHETDRGEMNRIELKLRRKLGI